MGQSQLFAKCLKVHDFPDTVVLMELINRQPTQILKRTADVVAFAFTRKNSGEEVNAFLIHLSQSSTGSPAHPQKVTD